MFTEVSKSNEDFTDIEASYINCDRHPITIVDSMGHTYLAQTSRYPLGATSRPCHSSMLCAFERRRNALCPVESFGYTIQHAMDPYKEQYITAFNGFQRRCGDVG